MPRRIMDHRSEAEEIMAKALSAETIAIVKSTAPALQKHGVAITTRMYERLFEDESIKALFDQAAQKSGEQPKRLAAAILGYAQNIDKLGALKGAVARMVARHVETGVHAEHYPYVANALLPAIRDVLGDAATDEVLAAWGEAYWFLADILIAAEAEEYTRQAPDSGIAAAA
jgi:hemoglobin-like flavoprotein